MWWQYLIMAIISISAALIAVRFDHWLSGRNEYRKAINCVSDEIAINIKTCDFICRQIDNELAFLEKAESSLKPYQGFHDLSWGTWKSVFLLRNSELAGKINETYFYIPIANKFVYRMEELGWGSRSAIAGPAADWKTPWRVNLEDVKGFILGDLLPRLKDAKGLLEKES